MTKADCVLSTPRTDSSLHRPMFPPPRADSGNALPAQPAIGLPENQTLTSEFAKPSGGLSRRLMLVGLATVPSSLPVAAAPLSMPDDRRLIELEEMIMAEHRLATQHDDEIWRLSEIWHTASARLSVALRDVAASEGRLPTEEERDAIWKHVGEMPECNEHNRLAKLGEPHFARLETLTKEMWTIPAHTSRGRSAKLNVLLTTVMGSTWRDVDEDVDYDARLARQLLLEFAGEEVSTPWNERFAAKPVIGGQS